MSGSGISAPSLSSDIRLKPPGPNVSPSTVTNRARTYVASDSMIGGSVILRDGGSETIARYGAKPGTAMNRLCALGESGTMRKCPVRSIVATILLNEDGINATGPPVTGEPPGDSTS